MLEVHMSHVMKALTEEKTKAPSRGLYVKLQKILPAVKNELPKWKSRSSLPRKLSMLDHPRTNLPVKLCSSGKGP